MRVLLAAPSVWLLTESISVCLELLISLCMTNSLAPTWFLTAVFLRGSSRNHDTR